MGGVEMRDGGRDGVRSNDPFFFFFLLPSRLSTFAARKHSATFLPPFNTLIRTPLPLRFLTMRFSKYKTLSFPFLFFPWLLILQPPASPPELILRLLFPRPPRATAEASAGRTERPSRTGGEGEGTLAATAALQAFSRQQKLQKKESLDWSQRCSMPRTSPSSAHGASEHFLLTVVFLVGPETRDRSRR